MIRTNVKLPNIEINKDRDFYFFPYFATGVDEINFNSIVREKILTGQDSVVLKPAGLEYRVTLNDNNELIREYKTNDYQYFQGKLTNLNFSTKIRTLTLYTKINVETSISAIFIDTPEKSMIWNFQTQTIKKDFVNFFFFVPELNQNDFLFITSVKVNIDPRSGEYISHFVNFASLADLLNQTGRTVSQKIQLAAPGENFIIPKVKITGEVKTVSFEEIKREGVKYLQIEPDSMFGWSSIRVWGRKKTDQWNKINDPTRLFISKFLEPKPTSWARSQNYELNFSLINITPTIISWFNSWKKEDGKDIIFPDNRRKNYGSFQIKTRKDFNILNDVVDLDVDDDQRQFNARLEEVNTEDYKKISIANALNLNSEFLTPMNSIEFGNSIFKNSKAKTKYWVGTAISVGLGAVGGLMFGKAGAVAGGLVGKFINPIDNLLPSNIFNEKVFIKYPNKINLLFPTEILKILTAQFEVNGDENNINLPIDIFESTNALKSVIETQSFRTTLLFSLTDEVKFNELKISTIDFYKTKTRYISPKFKPLDNNNDYVIDKIELKGLGKTRFRITAFDSNLRPVFFLNTQNQAFYSDDLREWTTEYTFNNDKLDSNKDWTNYTTFVMEDANNWANPTLPPPTPEQPPLPVPEETMNEISYFENGSEITLEATKTKIQPEILTNRDKLIANFRIVKIKIISNYGKRLYHAPEEIVTVTKTDTVENWLNSNTSFHVNYTASRTYLKWVGGRLREKWVTEDEELTSELTFIADDNANVIVIQTNNNASTHRKLRSRKLAISFTK